jgi:NAD(P)-dependent dehydrogenase (short-subunit alcohol dehydrogenase family)
VSPEAEPDAPVAIVCGSESLVGRALVSRLRDERWRIVTVDPPGAAEHHAAEIRLYGPLQEPATWQALLKRLRDDGVAPLVFIHAVSGYAGPGSPRGAGQNSQDTAFSDLVEGAMLGCKHVTPLMTGGDAAIVFLTSVLAGWDTPEGAGGYSASQAGLLALTRSLALSGGRDGIRVNAVAMGVLEDDETGQLALLPEVRGRVPLGRAASPDDIVDAITFLLSADAGHITGSTLVVDGGQSLQSWSNAPRVGHYSQLSLKTPHPRRHPLRGYPAPRSGVKGDTPQRSEPPLLSPTAEGVGGEGGWRRRAGDEGPWGSTVEASHPQRFQDRTVLITGAAGGLGSAAARRFGLEGARLALLDRDGAAAAESAEQLAAEGHVSLALEADVADEQSLAAAIAAAEAHFRQIDVLFNNAGVGSRDLSLIDTPADHWEEVLAINLRGVFLGCKYGVPALIRAGGGAIVNMGSSTGRHDTITGGAAYMASKAAVEALTKSLALQVAPYGIRANTICPGIIQTRLSFRQQERGDEATFFAEFADRIPLGRVGQPEDVAAAVAFLASDQARHITGAALLIDGGQTLRRWMSAPDLASLEA